MAQPKNFCSEREAVLLAPYAMHSADSAGRVHAEPPHPYRGPYQRDRDRILHCAAFRRLSYKTQVFMGAMGDYHRTRLTHTLEVSSIARTLARALRLNEDLVEALALLHDIGHPPFGHSGEDVLDECLQEQGGFDHNSQALRIVELVEARYPEFPGLNLSREVLEGQRHRANKQGAGSREHGVEKSSITSGSPPSAPCSPLLEVQVVEAADSIAYDAHDADDALELGLVKLDELLEVPLWREADRRVAGRFANLNARPLRRAIVHALINWRVSDLLDVVGDQLEKQQIQCVADVRCSGILVHASPALADLKQGLERFLIERVYRHPDVLSKRRDSQQALREMFRTMVNDPDRLPGKFREFTARDGVPRAVADYLAGMTDRFALEAHARLTAD
jgi:dGTPase